MDELLYKNKYFKILKGKSHYLKYNENNNGVVGSNMLILNEDQTKILLINIYRDPIKQNSWEIPRGGADYNEDCLACAKREAEEETGYVIKNIKRLGKVAPESGTISTKDFVYYGIADETSVPEIVNTDDIILYSKWFSLDEIKVMIKNDDIICGFTLSTILKYFIEKKLF